MTHVNTPPPAARYIASFAALQFLASMALYAVDSVLTWLGFHTGLWCSGLPFMYNVFGLTPAILLTSLGTILSLLSGFHSKPGATMFAGGLLLGILPMHLTAYLPNATCP